MKPMLLHRSLLRPTFMNSPNLVRCILRVSVSLMLIIGVGFEQNTAQAQAIGDGRQDLLLQHNTGLSGAWFMDGYNQIGAAFTQPGGLNDPVDIGWRIAGTGDFNADGRPDIVWQHSEGVQPLGWIAIWFMDGTNRLDKVNPALTGWAYTEPRQASDMLWRIKTVGDLNGDAKPDLVWEYDDGTTQWQGLWLMNGINRIEANMFNPQLPLNSGWTVAAAADFNADGKSDIVWQNSIGAAPTGDIAVWFMNGTNKLSSSLTSPPTGVDLGWRIKSAADFNSDNKPDLIWQHSQDWSGIWFMTSTNLLNAVLSAHLRFLQRQSKERLLRRSKLG